MKLAQAALLLATVALAAAPERGHAAAGVKPDHFTLANGLEVVVIPDHRTPVVTHMIWYKVGSADETPGRSGLAHFLEHLMFKGTEAHPGQEFSQTVARLGGQENAFTSYDYTAYYQRVARDHLPTVMALEADRMSNLTLTDAVVRPELSVVLEEQYQRVANNPAAQLGEQIQAALYLNHPYGRPVIGWRAEIETLTRADAVDFYRRFYAPNNAVLVVAGDVETREVRRLAEETYGKVARREIAARRRPQEPEPIAERRLVLADARVGQPSLQRLYLVPSETTAQPGEAEALDVLAHILANGTTSRLYRRLVVEKGVAAGVSGWYQSTSLDPTRLALSLTPREGVELAALEAALDEALAEVVERGATDDELRRAKARMIADMVYAQDNQTALARLYGAALTTGQTVERVYTWTDRIEAVGAEAVTAAARRWLDKRRSVTGYLVGARTPPEGKRS
ncbi:MAG: insulinase family protein [Variibacter sp.]|nr:insulinase family protein [Variibacter sp.]